MDKHTLGHYFIKDDESDEIYQQIAYTDKPTVMLKNVRTGKQITGVVGCHNFKDFKLLMTKEEFEDETKD